jgi:hypothetical protein
MNECFVIMKFFHELLANRLTKLVIRFKRTLSKSYQQNSMDTILIICALLKEHCQAKSTKGKKVDKDSM